MASEQLAAGTYEVLRNRLREAAQDLERRLEQLNKARGDVFGNMATRLLSTIHVTTDHNCIPRDLVTIGSHVLLGYNVQFGLKLDITPNDVFSSYRLESEAAKNEPLTLLNDPQFNRDFSELYRYYKQTRFYKFFRQGPFLHMVFQVGKTFNDIKSFKWQITSDGLTYIDNRSDHEVKFPPQHEFHWQRTTRDQHRKGQHPHISINDLVFVECVGGDLTVKIEDNTALGSGIYSEPVENADQTLDDAEIYFAILGNLVLLKIKPYLEKEFRYLVFNVKRQEIRRIDPIKQACVLLPEDHGIIFPGGYQLQSGGFKLFDHGLEDMLYERTVSSPNGEDFLYLFYNRSSGAYIQLRYNLIRQEVETPLICHGQAFFNDGHMLCFRAQEEPQKHHALQVWQTPFVANDFKPPTVTDSFLFKIGNADLVKGAAECQQILQLINRDDEYSSLFVDLEKLAGDVLDSYFWLDREETMRLAEPIKLIRDAASAAVEEFAKVVRQRRDTETATATVEQSLTELIKDIQRTRFEQIDDFVGRLTKLRAQRGQIISLKDLKYVDAGRVQKLEQSVIEATERLGRRCVTALLEPHALQTYQQKIQAAEQEIQQVQSAANGRKLDGSIGEIASALELLIDMVGTLKIEDTTQRTAIIDRTGDVLSELNRVRTALRARLRTLNTTELQAEFASQTRLLDQAVAGAIDTADSPDKVDQALTRLMVQLQEMESRFADADELLARLVEKRESIYETFEAKKQQLVEARNRKAESLATAANRVLDGIVNRALKADSQNTLNTFLAADPMVDKVRQIADQLKELGDTVRMNDLLGKLKSIGDNALRQLRDRQELFADGSQTIRLGAHAFAVNQQPIELTTVVRDQQLQLHLTGTQFFEPLNDPELEAIKDVWTQAVVSENDSVYRGEYLAWQLREQLQQERGPSPSSQWNQKQFEQASQEAQQNWVREQMAGRFREAYARGVHDHDAALILAQLLQLEASLGLLRFSPNVRGCAWFVWSRLVPAALREELEQWLRAFATILREFPHAEPAQAIRRRMSLLITRCGGGLLSREMIPTATDYLLNQLVDHVSHAKAGASKPSGNAPVCSAGASDLLKAFHDHLPQDGRQRVADALKQAAAQPLSAWALAENTIDAFLKTLPEATPSNDPSHYYRHELCRLLLTNEPTATPGTAKAFVKLSSLRGDHPRITQGQLTLHYWEFQQRLSEYRATIVPRFELLMSRKQQRLDAARVRLRAEEFKAKVLTSFVRNRLIDEVYLPLIGNNLAKQIGAAGEKKRSDRMGLLLLISPPGYGKTTLMEYIANRLGLVLVKVNGPALGHEVTSLDPAAANNAAARQELQRINLALEMGDNVMLYLDDIQHCNPELLQKFISLCDATRRIEGVWNQMPKTYDLRGRQVAVVMAGNPYTESGDRFQIPDMLANRADVYNLGEIIGDSKDAFEMSYLENCLTSNPVLEPLARASSKDQRALIHAAEIGSTETVELEAPIAADQMRDMVRVLQKLLRIRDVVLRVNRCYIRSAAQADAYRTEPPFKLQGSYRNMNRIAERVVPVMNDQELESLIMSSYEQEAQTLTRDSEANLLKFKELLGCLTPQENERWEQIKYAFVESVKFAGMEGADRGAQILQSISGLRDGLENIRRTMAQAIASSPRKHEVEVLETGLLNLQSAIQSASADVTQQLNAATGGFQKLQAELPEQKVLVQHSVPRVMLDLVQNQFQLLYDVLRPVFEQSQQQGESVLRLRQTLESCIETYQQLIQELRSTETN